MLTADRRRVHPLRALSHVCSAFGGSLAIVSLREFERLFNEEDSDETPWGPEDLSVSPFTLGHGLWWRKKIVYAVRGHEEVGSIIHEMGHVFAEEHHPDHHQCCEWNWFGWEVSLARQIGAFRTWSRQNSNYLTSEGGASEWGMLTAKRRRALIADRLVHARKIGVLDASGAPRCIR